MSKDKKRKFQAIFTQNQSASPSVIYNPHTETDHHILKNDLIKVFILTFGIIAIYIGLFFYDSNTGKVTQFAEHISSYVIK